MYIPRIRRVADVIKIFKEEDKDTMITQALIKNWIKQGKVACRKYGNAYVVNLDELYKSFKRQEANDGQAT